MDGWLYCYLPGANRDEFESIDQELRRREVIADAAECPGGGRVYRVHRSCLDRLPKDENGPYLGDDDSGYGLYGVHMAADRGPWVAIHRTL